MLGRGRWAAEDVTCKRVPVEAKAEGRKSYDQQLDVLERYGHRAYSIPGQGIFLNQFRCNDANWIGGIQSRYDRLLLDFFQL
jgi:hypothetical protein